MTQSLRCRLPYEMEWEYACRANTKTLFVWGNVLPMEEELAGWLNLRRPDKWKSNAFGLYALFSGDWCNDEYRPSHEERAEVIPGVFVIKGGGSIFWPWQDEEWIWCMPANRMPSTGLIERKCAFRLVRELSFLESTSKI
jgi:formylglycine-generating enzyme required for sulfatase activity